MVRQTRRSRKFSVSNELLAVLLVVAIGLSVVSFFTQSDVTGYVTDTATNTVNIQSVTSINWTNASVTWGAGSVNSGESNATLINNGTVDRGNWTANSTVLVLENIGGDNVNLTLKSDKTAATLTGGTNPGYWWQVNNTYEHATAACIGHNSSHTNWTAVSTSEALVCGTFNSSDASDAISLNVWIDIPSDATLTGAQTATITATGTTG